MGRFEGDAFEGLRTLIGLHAEPMHLVCLQGAGVNQFSDIAGKRVSMGDPGSGTLFTAQAMLEAKGMSEAQVTAEYLRPAEAPDFLRDGRIDCFFYTVGVGNAAIRDIMATANAMLVPLDDPEFEDLIDEFPYYAFSTVPAGTYGARQPDPVTLFGVKALFVGSTDALRRPRLRDRQGRLRQPRCLPGDPPGPRRPDRRRLPHRPRRAPAPGRRARLPRGRPDPVTVARRPARVGRPGGGRPAGPHAA
jgi:hypothetical protein